MLRKKVTSYHGTDKHSLLCECRATDIEL